MSENGTTDYSKTRSSIEPFALGLMFIECKMYGKREREREWVVKLQDWRFSAWLSARRELVRHEFADDWRG